MSKQKLNINSINETSLTLLLNFALSNLSEEREAALQHHDVLSSMLNGPPGGDGLSGLEIQLMTQTLSAALNNFLGSASKSTEQIIKIAKLLADYMLKVQNDDLITDDDREALERLVADSITFNDENENLSRD